MPERAEQVSISIDGKRFWGWSGLSMTRGIDIFSHASFVVPFEPDNAEFRRVFRPFTFREITIDVGDERVFTGVMFVNPELAVTSRQVKIDAYAAPAVLQDAYLPPSSFPLEFRGLNLQQVAEALCRPFGLSVAFQAEIPPVSPAVLAARRRRRQAQLRVGEIEQAREEFIRKQRLSDESSTGPSITQKAALETLDQMQAFAEANLASARIPYAAPAPDAPFRRVRVKPDQRPFEVLAELAKQRNVVINDMADGTLRFWQSQKASSPVARFVEGEPPMEAPAVRVQPQAYYSEITGLARTGATRDGSRYTVRNPHLSGVVRPFTFVAEDSEAPDLPAATRAKLGRMLGNAITFEVPLPTWRDPRGALWTPNSTVSLTAPGVMLYRETELIVSTVTLTHDSDSRRATLGLVLPGAFSGELPEQLPWD